MLDPATPAPAAVSALAADNCAHSTRCRSPRWRPASTAARCRRRAPSKPPCRERSRRDSSSPSRAWRSTAPPRCGANTSVDFSVSSVTGWGNCAGQLNTAVRVVDRYLPAGLVARNRSAQAAQSRRPAHRCESDIAEFRLDLQGAKGRPPHCEPAPPRYRSTRRSVQSRATGRESPFAATIRRAARAYRRADSSRSRANPANPPRCRASLHRIASQDRGARHAPCAPAGLRESSGRRHG